MAAEERGGEGAGCCAGPYAGVAELTSAALELPDTGLATAFPRWVRPLADYERRETTIVEGLRYG